MESRIDFQELVDELSGLEVFAIHAPGHAHPALEQFKVGDAVEGDYDGKGEVWYKGEVVTLEQVDDAGAAVTLYSIRYDDRDKQAGVPAHRVRAPG